MQLARRDIPAARVAVASLLHALSSLYFLVQGHVRNAQNDGQSSTRVIPCVPIFGSCIGIRRLLRHEPSG